MSHLIRCCVLCLLALASVAYGAGETRPRVGLVLGGGGARGAAHIGVLEVLRELRVPVDCVVGTSMGGLIAGVWAAGMSPEMMRANLGSADWDDMFQDNPEYAEMSPRNKRISRQFLPGSESGVGADGVRYQGGVVAGQKIKLFFNQLVRANQGERNIEDLPLPLSVIATDIGTGERVVFRDGALTTAMRASMSVPGLIAPVDHQGRKLVDGGLVDNLPVGEARERCRADVVIAVNVGSPLLKADEVGSLITVSAQMIGILTEQNVSRSLATLRPGDIYIKPDLGNITAGDFSRHAEAAERGRQAAQAVRAQLAGLAVGPAEYAAWWRAIEVLRRTSPRIDGIEIAGLARVNPAVIERHLEPTLGDTVRPTVINRDLLRMYGDGHYESVDYTVQTQHERTVLRVMPVEKRWGPDYLRLGLNLQADNSEGSSFGLRLGYHQTWLNALGGELLYSGEIGTVSRLGVEYYQPLDPRQRLFFQAQVGGERQRLGLYQQDQRVAQYLLTEGRAGAWLGSNLGRLGSVKAGWVQRRSLFEPEIGLPTLPKASETWGGWQVALDFEQFDRMYFPTRGWSAYLAYFEAPALGVSRADIDLRAAYPVGGTVFSGRLRQVGSVRGELPGFDVPALGGFKNMTAFARNQILGDDISYAGLSAERIIGRLPLGLRGDMRIGLMFEAAKVGKLYTETTRTGLIDSTALYVGGETPFGPTYVGFGYSSSGVSNLFLFVGTP